MSSYDEIKNEIYTALYKLSYERRQVLFGNPKDFKKWLKIHGVTEQDPITKFSRILLNDKNENEDLYRSYENRFKVTIDQLNYKPKKNYKEMKVDHRKDLAKKYFKNFVGYSDILEDLKIIEKGRSVIFLHDNEVVGGVIRDITSKEVETHFGNKMKATVKAHPPLRRGKKTHPDDGKLVGHGTRANFLEPSTTGTYVYNEKDLDPETQKVCDNDGNSLAKWLYETADIYLPWTMKSYKEFKEYAKIGDDKIIGALFCAENYQAAGHRDKDKSEFAVGFVFEEGIVKEGHFIYPEYGVAIEMTSNSVWCWKTQAVHGTARLDLSQGGTRYTGAITLTQKTATAIEKEKGLKK